MTNMTITVTQSVGTEFGTSGSVVTETKVFNSLVDFNTFVSVLRSFDAENEIVSVHFDCK